MANINLPVSQRGINGYIKQRNATPKYIQAYYKGHVKPISYTMAVYDLLKTDKDITDVIDAVTGEILWSRQ